MTPELIYFIKVNLALILLYGFYRLFFYKDTYFNLRRIILLLFFALAFSYPLFNTQQWLKMQQPIAEVIYTYSAFLPEVEVRANVDPEAASVSWTDNMMQFGFILYWLISGLLFCRFLVQVGSILWIARQSKRSEINGIPVYVLSKPASPFSFFNMIFVHPASHSENELKEILTHESTHVSQWHSVDVIISEFVLILCWINPFVWLLKREIKHNLEYLADNKVIHAGYDSKAYQFHLLGLTHYETTTSIYNNFNVLDIKNRIIMMNKKRSGKIGRAKYLMFLPFAALLLQFCNMERAPQTSDGEEVVKVKGQVVDADGQSILGAAVVIKERDMGTITDIDGNFELEAKENETLSISFPNYDTEERLITAVQSQPKTILRGSDQKTSGEQVFTVVEDMPRFPGGDQALLQFLHDNIKYPKAAQESGIHGRVIASFVVKKDGTIGDAEIVRSVDPVLDAEALRVIGSFPAWSPGKQRGQAVNVKYTVPVTFRLSGKNIPEKEVEKTSTGEPVFTVVEDMPKFPGGDQALLTYIAENVKYPIETQKAGVQGRVIVACIITKEGKIDDVKVVRGVSAELDKEAVRVIGSMPTWTPGKQRGKTVNVKYTIPVTFRLQ